MTPEVCKLVCKVQFPLKPNYDLLRRGIPALLPKCILRDAKELDCDEFPDKPDSDDVEAARGAGGEPPELVPESPSGSEKGDSDEEDEDDEREGEDDDVDGTYHKQDAIGRWYKYGLHSNRIFSKPLHGYFKPPSIPGKEWKKLSKKSKKSLHEAWKRLEHGRDRAVAEMLEVKAKAKNAALSSPPSVSAAAAKSKNTGPSVIATRVTNSQHLRIDS